MTKFEDKRSSEVKAICGLYKADGCREVCPLAEPCKMKPSDNYEKFISRINNAANDLSIKRE